MTHFGWDSAQRAARVRGLGAGKRPPGGADGRGPVVSTGHDALKLFQKTKTA